MRKNDIRFSGEAVTLKHHSARGRVTRNAGNFTRGSQLLTHEILMIFAGVRIPFLMWFGTFVTGLCLTLWIMMDQHEVQLVLMKLWSDFWTMMDFDGQRAVNLTLPNGWIRSIAMALVSTDPSVHHAWTKAVRCVLGSAFMAIFIAAPLTIWFVDISRRRGRTILEERHERGALLVAKETLANEVRNHNEMKFAEECRDLDPPLDPKAVRKMSQPERWALGLHRPYTLAGIPFPWRLEQSHSMFIGTTGTGKTTQLRSLVAQIRSRGHRAVIFDLTGAFVEAFFDETTDVILNPMDERCPPWTIFDECHNYADYVSAAEALIPSDPGNSEPFWPMAARTLFVETCVKLKERGETSNAAIAHHLMTADLKRIHALLANTVADPLTAEKSARMAESIRAVFNTNAQALRFLPDPKDSDREPFSVVDWMTGDFEPGSILFITSSHTDLALNRALLTLWMDLAVNSLLRLPRTRELRTWFLFDEVHALHRLPAIEHGLQTARGFGGAFVLGMHSFDKLVQTYGEEGAVNLAGLARTKLILATADRTTAETCAEFIGNREVRQMDEAYSYGYNNTRDASTLTPRKLVEPLVIPDDIANLPSMHGFVKFPDGFPAARIKLAWKDYPHVAEGFERRKDVTPNVYVPPVGKEQDADVGGREQAPKRRTDENEKIGPEELSQAERDANALDLSNGEDAPNSVASVDMAPIGEGTKPEPAPATAQGGDLGRGRGELRPDGYRVLKTGTTAAIGPRRAGDHVHSRAEETHDRQTFRVQALGKDGLANHEELIAKETREGAGVMPIDRHHHHHGPGLGDGVEIDDDMDMGR